MQFANTIFLLAQDSSRKEAAGKNQDKKVEKRWKTAPLHS